MTHSRSSSILAHCNYSSRQQLGRRLKKLKESNLIFINKKGAHTTYTVNKNALSESFMKSDYLNRPQVFYDADRMDKYEPNIDFLLDNSFRKEMKASV